MAASLVKIVDVPHEGVVAGAIQADKFRTHTRVKATNLSATVSGTGTTDIRAKGQALSSS